MLYELNLYITYTCTIRLAVTQIYNAHFIQKRPNGYFLFITDTNELGEKYSIKIYRKVQEFIM